MCKYSLAIDSVNVSLTDNKSSIMNNVNLNITNTIKKDTSFTEAFLKRIEITVAKKLEDCSRHDLYLALAYAVRDVQVFNWVKTQERQKKTGAKNVY